MFPNFVYVPPLTNLEQFSPNWMEKEVDGVKLNNKSPSPTLKKRCIYIDQGRIKEKGRSSFTS